MSGWAIVEVGGGTITLPKTPETIEDANPVQIDEVSLEGGEPVLVSRYKKARKLTLQGYIWQKGLTNGTIESTYLAPLRNLARRQVTITSPDSQFGGTWLMADPDFRRQSEGSDVRYYYTIQFKRGGSIVVL